MSQKCPHCGSYNTDAVIINYIERGFVHFGRGLISFGAGTICSLAGPSVGKAASYSVWNNTAPCTFYGHKCHNRGKEF